MIAKIIDFAAGQVTRFIAAKIHDFKNQQQHKILREESRKMEQLLKEHFVWDKFFDERYHCNYCSYNSQLANACMRHFAKKHDGKLVVEQSEPDQDPNQEQDPEQEPGQVQDPEGDYWQKEIELENLDTEEQ